MDARALREMPSDELRQHMTSLLREQFALRMQKATGQLSRPSRMKAVRREIARARTILAERWESRR